jgi:sugar phosphate permease
VNSPNVKPTPAPAPARARWFVLAVFVVSSGINYLDRQTLATVAPLLLSEFHLSNTQYGWLLAAFSISYAASGPFAGIMIDAVGLNIVASLAVGLWSFAGIATGLTPRPQVFQRPVRRSIIICILPNGLLGMRLTAPR